VDARAKKGPPSEVVSPPPNATFFRLLRVVGKGEKGKKAKCYGAPLPDGTVPDRWDVSEFSPAAILATFGPDKYRVDWYEADGTRVSGRIFTLAAPAQPSAARIAPARSRRRRERDEDLEPEDEPRRGRESESMSLREFLAIQAEDRREAERREERADQRRRDEAAAAQQRDREFMATVLGALVQQRSAPAESSDLLRRELTLELRQGMARLREELAGEEPDDPDPEEPPSIEGVGQAILGELESRAPHLVSELLPQVGEWLKTKGFVPSLELQQALAQRTANGRGSAGQG
jgi:hypothetical protein